ncbi:alpha/beta fold hydrolase [Reyranella soli]|uniref:alpha/beta fold hydrolase n=1 Tax=Reyranella soli TaxID=1230389 RepID=UPI0014783B91|nr:alpha/beta fold hydrolase [Reyranella soli]
MAHAAIALVVAFGVATSAAAQGAIGLIYMNGKQGPTNTAGSNDIAAKATAAGIKVIVPSMPWGQGGWEKISVTPDQVFGMIDGYASQLRAEGAQRIVVGGQSLGANVALSYAVARQNVAGVVMAAPGHSPQGSSNRNPTIRDAVDQACQLAKSGQGNQSFSGLDENQGNSVRVSTTAAVYCAWMNPRGLASMPTQASQLPANIPLMVIIGTKDPSFGFTEANIYRPAARNPYSKYVVIDGGDHRNTDHSASQRIIDWIKGLP